MNDYQVEPLWVLFAYELARQRALHAEAQAQALQAQIHELDAERARLTRVSKIKLPWQNEFLGQREGT